MIKQTELAELGEFKLISRLTKNFSATHKNTVYAIGDDCAVLAKTKQAHTLITTDLLMEGIHFDLMFTPLKHLGYKAVVVNLSDIYAMNGTPEHITVSIAVSAKSTVEALEELYEGIALACKAYSVDLIGGDTSASLTGLAISITAVGTVNPKSITYRNTAKKNDLICVSGDVGAAYAGLQIMQREKTVFQQSKGAQPKLEGYEYSIQRYLKPEARADVIQNLADASIIPTAMIDVSDGVSSELLHICSQSNVGCRIYEERIPIHKNTQKIAQEFEMEAIIPALNGGEDYELLFTIPIEQHEHIKTIPDVHIIGSITEQEQGLYMISRSGSPIAIQAQGWTAFE